MKTIDTSNWGEFQLGSLFPKVERATRRTVNSYAEGNVPYVTNSTFNNGITGYLKPKSSTDIEHGRCISINTVNGYAFWQEDDFLANSSGNGLLMLRRKELNRERALFLSAVITAALDASYAVMITKDTVRDVMIRLPTTSAGDPDWDYMEQTMCEVLAQQERELDELTLLSASRGSEVDTRNWKRIPMVKVFEMKNTKSITADSLVPDSGTTPYVTSQEGGNGVQMYVDCPDEWLDEGECIMIGGKTLTFSYQRQNFCSNDSHNIALYPLDAAAKSENCQLFLISALRASLSQIYSWGDSISMKRIINDSVMLPVTSTGTPDWDYMERTMHNVMAKREAALTALQLFAAGPDEP